MWLAANPEPGHFVPDKRQQSKRVVNFPNPELNDAEEAAREILPVEMASHKSPAVLPMASARHSHSQTP